MNLLLVCGLAAEARIAEGEGVTVIAGGGDLPRLVAAIDAAASRSTAILSFGIAGGLDPSLRPGDIRVASDACAAAWDEMSGEGETSGKGETWAADATWAAALSRRLGVPLARFAGADTPVATTADKATLRARSGAAMVDMETHVVARCAVRHGLRWGAVRVVTDSAARALPHAATVGMRPDGSVDLPAILASLARDPRQIAGLIRTGLDARAAFASLFRCRQLLGPGFALLDL